MNGSGRRTVPRSSLAGLLLGACTPWSAAEDGAPIATDRPSFSTAPLVLPPGRVQLESGATWTRADSATDSIGLPEAMLRVGVHERVEFRALAPGWSFVSDAGGERNGFDDLGLAVKSQLVRRNRGAPDLGIEGYVTFDTGDTGFGSGNTDGGVKLLLGQALDDETYVVVNLILATQTGSGARWTQRAASVYASRALSGRASVFAEWYVLDPVRPGASGVHSPSAQSVAAGFQYLPTPRVALDARVGAGLDDAADESFLGIGASVVF